VERILEERGTGKDKRYKVRFLGWAAEQDAWLPRKDIGSEPIASWKASQQAAREAVAHASQRFESEQARRYAKEHAASTIDKIRRLLIERLRAAKQESKRHILLTLDTCDEWLYNALFEHLSEGLTADELADYVTLPKQTAGGQGGPRVAFSFHVVSGSTASSFLAQQPQEPRRAGHVVLRDTYPATAVGLMTPITFTRSHLRDAPGKSVLRVTAGFGALADRNDGAPDWRFDDKARAGDQEQARGFITDALIEMNQRSVGVVPAQLLATAEATA
jgi:hypothetical protein